MTPNRCIYTVGSIVNMQILQCMVLNMIYTSYQYTC